ncbi:hypothetical protein [Ralstonia sp. ASV6]|uniref:hypothetical protein n=1 Tax=Ralstonia sp. ASV6 TaxID=2795124 RepID=UPI0018EAE2E3|nr:hypothetical protein [Ralstonia sp. ASV6]
MIHESAIQVAGNWMICEFETLRSDFIRIISLGSVEMCDLPADAKRARAARLSLQEAGEVFFDAIPPGRKLVVLHQDRDCSPQNWRRTQLLKRDLLAAASASISRGDAVHA